jgi:hypothetical protein
VRCEPETLTPGQFAARQAARVEWHAALVERREAALSAAERIAERLDAWRRYTASWRPVQRYDLHGRPSGPSYPNRKAAARDVGVAPYAIVRAIRAGGVCRGFRWSYAGEQPKPRGKPGRRGSGTPVRWVEGGRNFVSVYAAGRWLAGRARISENAAIRRVALRHSAGRPCAPGVTFIRVAALGKQEAA